MAIEREETLERLRADVLHQSEQDGCFTFKRLRQCAYKQPLIENDLIQLDLRNSNVLPHKDTQKSLVVKTIVDDDEASTSEPDSKKMKFNNGKVLCLDFLSVLGLKSTCSG